MTILIADDDASIRTSASMLLANEGLQSTEAEGTGAAIIRAERGGIELALIDMNYCRDTTSGMEGLELISALREMDEFLPIIVMTGWGSIGLAVEAMRRGAADFIEKPWQNERLLAVIRAQLELAAAQKKQRYLSAENKLLRSALAGTVTPVAESAAMQTLLLQVDQLAASDIPILITGENGTGKGLLAQTIHDRSLRANESFLAINMGGVAEQAFESEMFGHVKGAFTDARQERIGRLELAEGGSLFLDEIANTPLSQQGKLLRLLEEKCYEKLGSSQARQADVRFLSATNANLERAIEEKTFRRDLLYRLQGINLHIPPLRERQEDILPLAKGFLRAAGAVRPDRELRFDDDALDAMCAYTWPGNVRELHHAVERACLLSVTGTINAKNMQLGGPGPVGKQTGADLTGLTLAEAECHLIRKALERHQGRTEEAAQSLGLSRSAFYRRLEKHDLTT